LKRIFIVFGTRPEAIKMAPIIIELLKFPEHFESIVCVTGQHREMLNSALDIFGIYPDFSLDIMKQGQDQEYLTTQILSGVSKILKETQPDLVLVQGDTTTTFACALAAFYLKIPVAHIEAGLRTNDIKNPWPEEMNRSLTSRISLWHFAPTTQAKNNLLRENIGEDHIFITGNTIVDALRLITDKLDQSVDFRKAVIQNIESKGYDIGRLSDNQKLVLITCHRQENFGQGIVEICHAIKELAKQHPDLDFVFPVHLNPKIRIPVFEILGNKNPNKNIFLIEPIDYPAFIWLMKNSFLILSDSGGIQEEAPYFGKPILLLRERTERTESLETGSVIMTGNNRTFICEQFTELITNKFLYARMSQTTNPYGDGFASEKIVSTIISLLNHPVL